MRYAEGGTGLRSPACYNSAHDFLNTCSSAGIEGIFEVALLGERKDDGDEVPERGQERRDYQTDQEH